MQIWKLSPLWLPDWNKGMHETEWSNTLKWRFLTFFFFFFFFFFLTFRGVTSCCLHVRSISRDFGLKTVNVTSCTDYKALWGEFVIFGFVIKDWHDFTSAAHTEVFTFSGLGLLNVWLKLCWKLVVSRTLYLLMLHSCHIGRTRWIPFFFLQL